MARSAGSDLFSIVKARLEGIGHLLEQMQEPAAEELIALILRARRIFVTGKGRSGYVGNCLAMRLMQMGFEAHVPGEASCPHTGRGDLMIAISCSGTTVTTVELARIARESGVKVVAVTAVPDSPLAGLAHHLIVVPVTAGGVKRRYRYVLGPYNNTLFEEAMLLYFDAMVFSMLTRRGIPKRRLHQRHTNLQ